MTQGGQGLLHGTCKLAIQDVAETSGVPARACTAMGGSPPTVDS